MEVRPGVIVKQNKNTYISALYDFTNNHSFEDEYVIPSTSCNYPLYTKVTFITDDMENVTFVCSVYDMLNNQDFENYKTTVQNRLIPLLSNIKTKKFTLVKKRGHIIFEPGKTHSDFNIIVDIQEFIYGPEYYMINRFGKERLSDPNVWLKFMMKNDPEGNIYELFANRFADHLADLDGDMFKKLLYSHNYKWRADEYQVVPDSSREPINDWFSKVRYFGYVKYGGDRRGNYRMERAINHRVFDILQPLGEGELTKENYIKALTIPESSKPFTEDKLYPHEIEGKSIILSLDDFFQKRDEVKGSPSERIKAVLKIKDIYTSYFRDLIVWLSHKQPTRQERKENDELVKKYGESDYPEFYGR